MLIAVEVGLTHGGCLGTAMAFADAIADAGADIFKAQCHLGDPVSGYRPGMENYFHETRQEYWERTAFTADQWSKLRDKCHKRGLQFSCSVFSLAGVEMMAPLVDQFKVPSSKTNDLDLLRAVKATGKPIVLSTGMSTVKEIQTALDFLWPLDAPDDLPLPTVLQCVSEYPTPPEHISFESRYGLYPHKFGVSDHSGTIFPGLIAAWEHAEMLEVHCTWSKQAWGPDVSSSLTIEELKQLVEGVRFVEKMRASTVTKDELYRELEPVRRVFRGTD